MTLGYGLVEQQEDMNSMSPCHSSLLKENELSLENSRVLAGSIT